MKIKLKRMIWRKSKSYRDKWYYGDFTIFFNEVTDLFELHHRKIHIGDYDTRDSARQYCRRYLNDIASKYFENFEKGINHVNVSD